MVTQLVSSLQKKCEYFLFLNKDELNVTGLKWTYYEMVPIFLSPDLPVRNHEATQYTDWTVIGFIQDTVILFWYEE